MTTREGKKPLSCPVCGWLLIGHISEAEAQWPCVSCGAMLKITAEEKNSWAWSLLSGLPLPLYAIFGFAFALVSHEVTDVKVVANADATFQPKPEVLVFLDLKNAAEAGDASSQFKMGRETELGHWVERSEAEALTWYQKSADQGHVPAQQALGRMHFMGQGTARDYAESYFWYYVAEKDGKDREWSESVGRYLSAKQIATQQERAANWQPVKTIQAS
jgi:predicted RNA-binding Zn-ribbon protein involved in translation (DUF1610 family)